ncbi:hypothetical protein NMY22_g8 [Coprinellus aureogranulatus]|nr:hypothetical protein NMY22_g8 [Coprinellus aureogranulatus]
MRVHVPVHEHSQFVLSPRAIETTALSSAHLHPANKALLSLLLFLNRSPLSTVKATNPTNNPLGYLHPFALDLGIHLLRRLRASALFPGFPSPSS